MMAVDIDANNVVLMYVHPDLKIIPVLMPQRQNVAINVYLLSVRKLELYR